MKYSCTLLAVRDMDRALSFYQTIFRQEVVCDLGWNKTLSCGLVLQEHFDRIAGFPESAIGFRPHDMELYFETEDFDGFLRLLEEHSEVERLHEVQTFPWKQRGIRIFDPDGHLIEVSESMETVAFREFDSGKTVEETAEAIQHPVEVVRQWRRHYEEGNKELISVCGADCSSCACFGALCKGCNAHEGKVFHSPEGCPIHRCVRSEKHLHNCGKCDQAPCEIWRKTRDPKFTDVEFERNIAERIGRLKENGAGE